MGSPTPFQDPAGTQLDKRWHTAWPADWGLCVRWGEQTGGCIRVARQAEVSRKGDVSICHLLSLSSVWSQGSGEDPLVSRPHWVPCGDGCFPPAVVRTESPQPQDTSALQKARGNKSRQGTGLVCGSSFPSPMVVSQELVFLLIRHTVLPLLPVPFPM